MRERFAVGLVGLTLVAAAGCAVREPPPAAAPDAGAGIVRGPVEAGAHDVPVRPTLDASPTDLARFAEEVLVEAGVRGWALAVIHEGRPVERRFSAGVGGSVRTVDAGTMFDLQSVAKPVIAWGVMNLVEAGRVDLDQPIERYLSRWRLPPSDFDHREVTVRGVLSHTAGLSWGRRQQFAAEEILPPIEEVLSGTDAEGGQLEVIVEPGTRFIYSSGGYTLLQLLIEEVSGRPFAEFMEDEVLRPLGMHHSVFSPALPDAPVIGKMDALGRVAETDRVATASSLITDLEELTAFALAHFEDGPVGSRGRGVLRPATVDSMMAPVLAARSRRGLGYAVRRLDGDLLVAGHSGGGGDFRVVPETGDGLVILTNSTVGYFPIERILCVWTGWLTGTQERCPVPSSYALLGAYRYGGVPAALDYYDDLVDRADPDYVVGIEQLSDFARLFVGAGLDGDAAGVYRYIAKSGAPEGVIYGEAADGLLSGHQVPDDRLRCYLGEYRSPSGDTIRLERAGAGLTVTIDPVVGIGGPVRILTDRVFLFDFRGFIGELVFELADSGAATRVTVRESAFGISLTAERSAADATADAGCAVMQSPPAGASDADARVVRVAPPTGERETDRASILTALEQVEPSGTIQFAPGTYLVGETIRIATPRITLLGHAGGTVLRGCDPDEQEEVERSAVRALGSRDQNTYQAMRRRCGLLELTGGNVTVRGLTFEHARRGLVLGCCEGEEVSDDGGYLIEGNTFRNSANGIRASLLSTEPTVIRGNRFVNVFHALSAGVSHVHMLDNDISVPEPLRVPGTGHPGFAIGIRPPPSGPADGPGTGPPVCEQNVIAGNRIEGHTDGILLRAFEAGTSCRDNTIRDNVIQVRRVRFPVPWLYAGLPPLTNEADTTFVGVPLGLLNSAARAGSGDAGSGAVEYNRIEGNRILGAHGVGIQVLAASRNRIVGNTLAGIRRRDPFPGNITTGSQDWREANGSGIWISPGSEENEILGNTFEDIRSAAIVLEGNRNRVETRRASDGVRDLGAGNRVGSTSGDPFDGGAATTAGADSVADSFVVAGGVRLHYLDFGGEGLPVVFVHSEAWTAHTYAEFAPRFADRNRVLAVTRPGYGDSEAHPDGFDIATQGRSLIDFLDALEIERAVFAGNASATAELTFLGEHHADRVAGLIYFTGLAVPWLEERDSDPTRAFEMFRRASPGAGDVAERVRARKAYRPELLRADRPTIGVPALAFVARSGTKGNERGIGALALVGSPLMADVRSQMPPSPVRDHLERLASDESYRALQLEQIADPGAREYFLRLAADPELQERIYRYHEEVVLPALRAGQERARRAFADDPRLVRLDVDQVVGYEYRDAPHLVEPHIRRFLADLEPISEESQDTTRFTIIINGHHQGERRMWQEAPDTWRYEHDGDAYHFPRTERLVLDSAGVPVVMEIDGQRIVWDDWVERYERSGGRARWTAHAQSELGPEWSRALDEGEAEVPGAAYYAALHPVHDLGVLARLLLRNPGRTVPLLPNGTARLELVGERWVEVDGARRRIRLFAIHGLDLKPSYVWLDDDDATFADEWSVLAGWEAAFPDLRSASDRALAEHHRGLARDLVPPARERPLVIRGARLFDPSSGQVTPGTTVVVEGSRISAIGPDGALDLPPRSEVVDAAGRTVLPGLWDMHAHHGFPGPYFELVAPLSLAGGITMARDLGMPTEPMLSLRRRIRAGEAVGPRLLMAGWVGGAGGRPTGMLVGNAAEARAAVDRYAELGYVQIKIYSDLPHELVPVVIERAKQHGLRVSGEIPWPASSGSRHTGMTTREAVEHGYEEIQHIDGLLVPLVGSALTELSAQPTPARLQAMNEALAELTPDSEAVEELVRLLASEGVAVDPTLTVFAAQGMESPPWVARVAARFPFQARRRILDRHLFGYWPLTPLWEEILGNMIALVGALHEAGVPVLPGTDTEMAAFDLHQELALYVEAGIPAPEVLALATLGAARAMGMDDELGSIEPGKLADLTLVDGDPTTDINDLRRVVMVVKDGRVYDPAAIHRALGIEP